MDLYEHKEQTRLAFQRVKRDIDTLQEQLDKARQKAEIAAASFEHYTDKKEFYAFIETIRKEMDRLEASIASKAETARVLSEAAKSEQADKRLEQKLAALESKLAEHGKLNKEDLRKADEGRAKAISQVSKSVTDARESSRTEVRKLKEETQASAKELSAKVTRLENELLSVQDDFRDLRRQLRLKDKQLEYYRAKSAAKPRQQMAIPWTPVIVGGLMILLLIALIAFIPSIIQPVVNGTGNETNATMPPPLIAPPPAISPPPAPAAPANQTDLTLQCISEYECSEVTPGNYYTNCAYNTTLESCACDTVSDEALCNPEAQAAAYRQLTERGPGTAGIALFVLALLGLVLFVLWLLSRSASGQK